MSPQASKGSPAPLAAAHGGDMDPNDVRLRQRREQYAAASTHHLAGGPSTTPTANSVHGGDMDPNEVRFRLARVQQTSYGPPTATGSSEPNIAGVSQEGVRTPTTHLQPKQNGPNASDGYQGAQPPQNIPSVHPTSTGYQPLQSFAGQPAPHSPHPSISTQVCFCQPRNSARLISKGQWELSSDKHLSLPESSFTTNRSSWPTFSHFHWVSTCLP